ncbi:hypothetical protein TIFTF001_026445 [Ficus carica]|uniref:Uncharacterized protein n=1 Tax=Ficus carica TaxID=3494 RepID=A0AA88DL69_FICCA|nr:hypothetical protein TIFTF001_026445 [Ficus carica]
MRHNIVWYNTNVGRGSSGPELIAILVLVDLDSNPTPTPNLGVGSTQPLKRADPKTRIEPTRSSFLGEP